MAQVTAEVKICIEAEVAEVVFLKDFLFESVKVLGRSSSLINEILYQIDESHCTEIKVND